MRNFKESLDWISDPPIAAVLVDWIYCDGFKPATVVFALNKFAPFATDPDVTKYSIKIILPSDNCLPTAPSPNKISYVPPSTSCKKKTFCVDDIVVTSNELPSAQVATPVSLAEFWTWIDTVDVSTFVFGIRNRCVVSERLTVYFLLRIVPS